MATLYVVATPIGNLEDITLRAIRVLKEVDLIAAEDTRWTRKLLSHYGISTATTSYHEHNEEQKAPYIVERLKEGKKVALVTDAGTPCISDPGYRLVHLAVEEGIEVHPVPGPSAIMAALSVSGLPTDSFLFLGFLPQKKVARLKRLEELKLKGPVTCVLYESPRRLKATLEDMLKVLGPTEAVVAREITKLHEEFLRGTVEQLLKMVSKVEPRGEITLVVRIPEPPSQAPSYVEELVGWLVERDISPKEVAQWVSRFSGTKRRELYQMALTMKRELKKGGR